MVAFRYNPQIPPRHGYKRELFVHYKESLLTAIGQAAEANDDASLMRSLSLVDYLLDQFHYEVKKRNDKG